MNKNYSTITKLVMLTVLIGLMVVLVTGCEEPEDNIFDKTIWTIRHDDPPNGTMMFLSNIFIIRDSNPWFESDAGYDANPAYQQRMDYNGTYTFSGNVATMAFTQRKLSSETAWTSFMGRATATLTGGRIYIRGILGNQQGNIVIEVLEE
jgi:hypothetical protein